MPRSLPLFENRCSKGHLLDNGNCDCPKKRRYLKSQLKKSLKVLGGGR